MVGWEEAMSNTENKNETNKKEKEKRGVLSHLF